MTAPTPVPRWQRRECATAEVDGSLVLLDLDGLVYHALNETASAAWRALDQPRTGEEIARALEAEFEVDPATRPRAVAHLLAQMRHHRLVEELAA